MIRSSHNNTQGDKPPQAPQPSLLSAAHKRAPTKNAVDATGMELSRSTAKAKRACADKGYVADPFASLLCEATPPEIRSCIGAIMRGTAPSTRRCEAL